MTIVPTQDALSKFVQETVIEPDKAREQVHDGMKELTDFMLKSFPGGTVPVLGAHHLCEIGLEKIVPNNCSAVRESLEALGYITPDIVPLSAPETKGKTGVSK